MTSTVITNHRCKRCGASYNGALPNCPSCLHVTESDAGMRGHSNEIAGAREVPGAKINYAALTFESAEVLRSRVKDLEARKQNSLKTNDVLCRQIAHNVELLTRYETELSALQEDLLKYV